MKEYHKIESIFKRDMNTRGHPFIEGAWTCPEFEYLAGLPWDWTEKIDGTNVRIGWDGESVEIGGRTDDAQMPTFLYKRLTEIFTPDRFSEFDGEAMLCGEGYGAKIQKGGGNYIPNGVDFILFDVMVGSWILRRGDVEDVAHKMGVKVVPSLFRCDILTAIGHIKDGIRSTFGDFLAEGIVGRPAVELNGRNHKRIITKIKHRDFGVKP